MRQKDDVGESKSDLFLPDLFFIFLLNFSKDHVYLQQQEEEVLMKSLLLGYTHVHLFQILQKHRQVFKGYLKQKNVGRLM